MNDLRHGSSQVHAGHAEMSSTSDRSSGPLLHAALTRGILVTFFGVYNELGSGFLESVYRTALVRALTAASMHVDREVPIDVFFRHEVIGRYYADLVVEDRVIVEVKAVRRLVPDHQAQLLHYLRATAMEVGMLLNFGSRPQFQRLIYSNSGKHGLRIK